LVYDLTRLVPDTHMVHIMRAIKIYKGAKILRHNASQKIFRHNVILLCSMKKYTNIFDVVLLFALLRNNLYQFFIWCASSSRFFLFASMSDAFHKSSFFLNYYSSLLYDGDQMQ